MFRHALSRACRCTSTSNSLPCRHAALTTSRSYSRKTSPNSFPSTTTSPSSSSSSYSYQPHVLLNQSSNGKNRIGGESKWFEPLQPHTFKSWLPPSSSSSSTTQPQLTSDEATNLLNEYLTTRGPRSELGKFEDEYGQLLEIAKEREMPFLKAMVLEDLGYGEMSNSERNKLGLDRFGRKDGVRGEEVREVKGFSEIVAFEGSREVGEVQYQGRKRTIEKEATIFESTTQDFLPTSSITPSQAHLLLSQLSDYSLASPTLDSTQLAQLWTSFSPTCDLHNSLSDFSTTLSILNHLLSLPSPSSNLPLALEIFSSLVVVLPEDLIASQPDSISSDQSIQFVLLRTCVNAALSEDLYELALEISLTLGRLHEKVEGEVKGKEEDLDHLGKAIEGRLGELERERKGAYQASKLESSRVGLERAGKGLELMREWMGASHEASQGMLVELKKGVEGFMLEAAERYRWDLISNHYKPWFNYFNSPNSPLKSPILTSHQLKFARYLSGSAPYSTYPSHVPLAQPDLFSFFVRVAHVQLREGKLSDRWRLEEKWDYLDLLLSSPGSTKETRSLARRIVSYWISTSPLFPSPSSQPFILRSQTLLSLLRSSTSPSPSHQQFSKSLINHFIQSLISPQSPYSTLSSSPPQLEHFDLTTLAQAYTILNDHDSVGQVYKKLLSLKLLPDQRDVSLILGNRGGSDVDGGVEFVRNVRRVGVWVGKEVLSGMLRGVIRGDGEGIKGKIEGVLRFAMDEVGLSGREMRELEGFVRREWEGPKMSIKELGKLSIKELEDLFLMSSRGDGQLSVKRGMGYLRKASTFRNFRLSIKIYRIFLRSSCTSSSATSLSPLFHSTLTTLLSSLKHSKSPQRPTIISALAQIIDETLSISPSTISSSTENLELTLRALVKVGEVEAIDRLFEELGEEVSVGRETKEMIVRWAVGREGREKVREGEGIVGEWAREVLREKEE